MKVEPLEYGDRRVYTVSAFNRGIASWLGRLPTVWVEGEVTELRRQERWQSVFFTLKDADGSCLDVTMSRGKFDGLRLDLVDGERVHVFGRPELYEARGQLSLRALTIERFGLGAHLAALERLKKKLAAEGLFAVERKRALPLLPDRIGLVTGNDAAAKRDVLAGITARFPPARILVAETYVQGPRAAPAIVEASTPTAAARLVVPDLGELLARLDREREAVARGARRALERSAQRLELDRGRLTRAPSLLLERRRARLEHTAGRLRALSPPATVARGYAIVRARDEIVRSSSALSADDQVAVELAEGSFSARVEETKP